jgi:hypothetical protein
MCKRILEVLKYPACLEKICNRTNSDPEVVREHLRDPIEMKRVDRIEVTHEMFYLTI